MLPVTRRPLHRVVLEVEAVSTVIATDILSALSSFHPSEISLKFNFSADNLGDIEEPYFPGQFQGRISSDGLQTNDTWAESKWKALDDTLVASDYTNLEEVFIHLDLSRELMPNGYGCEDELWKKMLPKLAASKVQLKSCGAVPSFRSRDRPKMCLYHRSVIRFPKLHRLVAEFFPLIDTHGILLSPVPQGKCIFTEIGP